MRVLSICVWGLLPHLLKGEVWPVPSVVPEDPANFNTFVPVTIEFPASNPNTKPGETGYNIRDIIVVLCDLDWLGYHQDPASLPMLRDLFMHSNCGTDRSKWFSTTFGELEKEFLRRGCSSQGNYRDGAPGCVPTGIVTHMSRCGSTLAANILASLPYALVYSEPSIVSDILYAPHLSDNDRAHLLRVLVAAMGRRITATLNYMDSDFTPRHMYFKLSSSNTVKLDLIRKAFPATPWVFLHREPVEVLASLFRNAHRPPAPDAAIDKTLNINDKNILLAPCMRSRNPDAVDDYVVALLGIESREKVVETSAEVFCAAYLSQLIAVAVREAAQARTLILSNLLRGDEAALRGIRDISAWDGYSIGIALRNGLPTAYPALNKAKVTIDKTLGYLYNTTTNSATITKVGLGMMIDYEQMPSVMVQLLKTFFHPRPILIPDAAGTPRLIQDTISERELQAIREVSEKYSKARGRIALPNGGVSEPNPGTKQSKPLRGPSLDAEGDFLPDQEEKQALAWPALKAAANKYITSIRAFAKAFNFDNPEARDAAIATDATLQTDKSKLLKTSRGTPLIPGNLAQHIPLGAGYPHLYPLNDILTAWNPDIVTVPAHYGTYRSIRRFDYQTELNDAALYRRAEVPFIIRNIPEMQKTVEDWVDDDKLRDIMGPSVKYKADVNDDNHFMFYAKTKETRDPNYKPPTEETTITFEEFITRAKSVREDVMEEEAGLPAGWIAPPAKQIPASGLNDENENNDKSKPFELLSEDVLYNIVQNRPPAPLPAPPVNPSRERRTLWYMRASTNPRFPHENAWIRPYFPIFDHTKKSFTSVDIAHHKGIHCRFGMPGIIAESHYDAGRNFIFMVRGRKRYIMSPPSECMHLHMLRDGPSARHSAVDWTDPLRGISALSNASAFEVILEPGEALYVPSFWFHFIVSLTINVQCNARSGTPPHGSQDIADCGFDARYTEDVGVNTDALPPLRHLAAVVQTPDSYKPTAVLPGSKMLQLSEILASKLIDGPPQLFGKVRNHPIWTSTPSAPDAEKQQEATTDAGSSIPPTTGSNDASTALHLQPAAENKGVLPPSQLHGIASGDSLLGNSLMVGFVALCLCVIAVSAMFGRRWYMRKRPAASSSAGVGVVGSGHEVNHTAKASSMQLAGSPTATRGVTKRR